MQSESIVHYFQIYQRVLEDVVPVCIAARQYRRQEDEI